MWLSDFFFPSIGVLLTNILWLAPFPKVQYSLRYRDLGTLNPVPYILMIFNCFGLVIYGCLKADHFIFWGEVFGMFLSIYYSVSSLLLCTLSVEHEDKHLNNTCCFLFTNFTMWSAICYYASSIDREKSVYAIGLSSCVWTVAYYGAPLSSTITILTLKNSSSIDINLVAMNFVCSTSWFIYAYMSINDTFIMIQNFIGCCLAATQFVLWTAYRGAENVTQKDNRAIDDSIQSFVVGLIWGFPIESGVYQKFSLCRLRAEA